MEALAVIPKQENSLHSIEIDVPTLATIPNGRGVLVKVLQVGVDATDSEINEGLYGQAPEGSDYLIIGHEVFGIVEEVGPEVRNVKPGDYCTCTVRRPGPTLFDDIGRNDITSHDEYYERGINLRHGFMTEKFVDDCEFIVKVPVGLKHLGVLSEPVSVCAKAIEQAYLAQTRLQVWKPQLAFVTGAGQIGLLTAMMLRLRGLEVYVLARTQNPGLKEEICAGYGAHYISTKEESVSDLVERVGRPDLVIEATGSSRVAFDMMQHLNRNGALVWTSVTGGKNTLSDFPSDAVNLEWVLGNKLLVGSVNGNRDHFKKGISDLALSEVMYPGVTEKILTTPINGFSKPQAIIEKLTNDKSALKVYVNVAEVG
jgi:glucose 1-dehydrogenase